MTGHSSQTPMMQQYERLRAEAPHGALLFFKLGDFYELFYEDAKIGSELLSLTLTQRNGTPMCGVPQHTIQSYISKLVALGRRVVICDQVSEPKQGQVVDRAITQVYSPGCAINLDLDAPNEQRFLAAAQKLEKDLYSFAWIDASTAQFQLTQLESGKELAEELSRLRPRELIFPSQQAERFAFAQNFGITLTPSDDSAFDSKLAALTLKEHFKVASLDGFGCKEMHVGSAGALLNYLSRTLRTQLGHITSLKTYLNHQFVILDSATQRHLELVESSQPNGKNNCLIHAIDHTITAMGARLLRQWVLHPLRERSFIQARQEVIGAYLKAPEKLRDFRILLKEVRDLERLMARIAHGSCNGRDLRSLAHSLRELPKLKKLAAELDASLAQSCAEEIEERTELAEKIERAIVEEPPLSIKEGGIIAEKYHAELDEFHKAMREGKDWIAQLQLREQIRTGIRSLKVRFNQVFGYYIEITSSNLSQVPPDYIRKQTMANAERFITPELKEMEGKILGSEERAKRLEYDLFCELRDQVAAETLSIQRTARAIAILDVLAGWANLAQLHPYTAPELGEDGVLHIRQGRHPVIEQTLGSQFISNDTDMTDDACRLMILTGPNMAGKSTYIRQVALITLLAHIGCYVPAKSSHISIVDRIFTRIGASDDLARGQSTFMVEMSETAYILHHATEKSLVVLDEIGRGTSTFDGLSIAWSVAEYLLQKIGCKTLFATHYHELTELEVLHPGVKNYHVAVRESGEDILFLHQILPGGADQSYGIHVARLAGLPSTVLTRAQIILKELEEEEERRTKKKQPEVLQKTEPQNIQKESNSKTQTHKNKSGINQDTDLKEKRENKIKTDQLDFFASKNH